MSRPDRITRQLSRRRFLRDSALVTAGAGLVQATARGQSRPATARVLGANDRIRIGLIGCGGLGTAHHIPALLKLSKDPSVNVELAAVCDIYEPRKLRAKEMSGAELFHDYHKLLDRPDIDGVVIATPDHWHARMATDAMEAGKDVHVEKPMTLYWEEAREVHRTAERLKRVVQVGAEGTSRDIFWQARRLIQQGKLGHVVWISGGVYRNEPGGDWNYPIDPACSPSNLDWDAFLGPAPKRPFDPERYFRYRKYWDYSGGVAHDLIAHILAAVQVCVGAEFPRRVSAAGGIYICKDRETPDTFSMQVEYPGECLATFVCTQTTEQGDRLIIRGDRATMRFSKADEGAGTLTVTPERPYAEKDKEFTVGEEPRMDHDRNFLHCMRTREKPHYDALSGYKAMVALGLAVRSWREGKLFTFDPEKQEIVGG